MEELLLRSRYERAPECRGNRNGHLPQRTIGVGLGAVEFRIPMVRDVLQEVAPDGFESAIEDRYERSSRTKAQLLSRYYLEGPSSSDFDPAFRALVGSTAALPPNSNLPASAGVSPGIPALASPPLTERSAYLFADGVYLKVGLEHENTVLLVVIGSDETDARSCWRSRRATGGAGSPGPGASLPTERGMTEPPLLAVVDGGPGLWASVSGSLCKKVPPSYTEGRSGHLEGRVFERQTNDIENRPEELAGEDAEPVGELVPEEALDELVAKVRSEGLDRLREGGVITELTKKLLERALSEELTELLGLVRSCPAPDGPARRRSGAAAWRASAGPRPGSVTVSPEGHRHEVVRGQSQSVDDGRLGNTAGHHQGGEIEPRIGQTFQPVRSGSKRSSTARSREWCGVLRAQTPTVHNLHHVARLREVVGQTYLPPTRRLCPTSPWGTSKRLCSVGYSAQFDQLAGGQEDHVLRDVGDSVGYPFQIAGDEHQVGCRIGQLRLLTNGFHQIVDYPMVDSVDAVVPGRDVLGASGVRTRDCLQDVADLLFDIASHPEDGVDLQRRTELDERQRIAGATFGVVAHALQLRGHQDQSKYLVEFLPLEAPTVHDGQTPLPLPSVALVDLGVADDHRSQPLRVPGLES